MLRWSLHWGEPSTLAMLEARRKQGLSTPALDNRPRPWTHLFDVYTCFMVCSRRRSERAAAIPISEIVAWLDLYGIDEPETRASYFAMVDAMDREFVDHFAKKGT